MTRPAHASRRGKSAHRRDMSGLKTMRRCGARTRAGTPCRAPVVTDGVRCRMHGGQRSGAPPGNANARTHGAYTRAERARRRMLNLEMERMDAFLHGVAHQLRRPKRSYADTQVRYRYTVHGVDFRKTKTGTRLPPLLPHAPASDDEGAESGS
ncbi:MAG: hypothetical protein CMM59_20050 [Rhodospirillaceae bacterium]|nr:hypothetical protein [Rhodospirillaceae bacterium]